MRHAPNPISLERLAELGQSLAGLMHDLRGPLTTITGFADLMSIEGDAEKRRALYEEISHQVDRVTRMSDDALAFLRGERPLLLRTVHLYELAEELEQLLEREFAGTPIVPTLELVDRSPALLDVQQILRAAENLARNAREAMAGGKGTQFRVTVERRGAELLFTFSDDGPGLPPEIREHAFSAFASVGKRGHTGLGLHLVGKIARDHGGTARVRDAERGTCIELAIPCDSLPS